MRTVWTMGFVAAAALSFCFPDFIVFRLTQAVIWAIRSEEHTSELQSH